jgi:hypothetical protein
MYAAHLVGKFEPGSNLDVPMKGLYQSELKPSKIARPLKLS